MEQPDVTKRGIGLNFTDTGQAGLVLWAPKLKKAEVLVNKGTKKLSLQKKEFGYWKLSTDAIKPGDKYQLLLDGEKKRPDPAALAMEDTVHGASIAVDLNAFKWDDHNWQNFPLDDLILYELHTGTFTPEGTLSGIESRLDYLLELGINAIEIMPVAQFPGNRNWGYDGVLPFAVQNTYGGAEGLQHLVNTCHKKGIAVVLDVVFNHIGPEGNYLDDFGHYFTDKYSTPWGNAINFDDECCDGVRRFFIENALMWFRDFHIDALRLDAVHAIKDFSPVHILREIKLHVDELMRATGRKHHLIVELDLNDTRFINPLAREGFGMDAQWVDEFHHALRVASGEPQNGYYSDFNGLQHLAKSYKDAYVFDGQYSSHRKKKFGIKAKDNPGRQFIVFSQNHDQVGNRMLGERTSTLLSFEMQKLLAAAAMLSPYVPMLFMGEEYSEPNPFQYFVSHTDLDLAEAVRKGRKAEFAAFHLTGEAPDPVAEETFNNSKLQWDLHKKEPHSTMFRYYQALISLRKTNPVLKQLNRKKLDTEVNEEHHTLSLYRWTEDKRIICLMNFSKSEQEILFPQSGDKWKKILDSASKAWNGPQDAPESVSKGGQIKLQPESILVYFSPAD